MKVAIIGAGPSGLTCLKTLRQAGLDAQAFEAGERVGGQWVMNNPGGMSSAYQSLKTNTNREMSRYSDFSFPKDYPEYPDHELMAKWFNDYAHNFDLHPHISLSTYVENVVKTDNGFEVITAEGSRHFDAVVAASGNLWDPVQPSFPGSFNGITLHAHDYRSPDSPVDLKDKTVIVVGVGNSGCEIAVELSEKSDVFLSARSGQYIMPRVKPGGQTPPHPSQSISPPFNYLPRTIRNAAFRFLMPRVLDKMMARLPDPESVGLPPRPATPFEKRSVVNDHIYDYLLAGRLTAKPNVQSLEGDKVTFVDGTSVSADVIVYATGYRFSLPYLSPELLGVDDAQDIELYRGIMHPDHQNLFVIGVLRALCSIWPYSEQQSRWIAAKLTGQFTLPQQRTIDGNAYPILKVPFSNCQFLAEDLRQEAGLKAET